MNIKKISDAAQTAYGTAIILRRFSSQGAMAQDIGTDQSAISDMLRGGRRLQFLERVKPLLTADDLGELELGARLICEAYAFIRDSGGLPCVGMLARMYCLETGDGAITYPNPAGSP